MSKQTVEHWINGYRTREARDNFGVFAGIGITALWGVLAYVDSSQRGIEITVAIGSFALTVGSAMSSMSNSRSAAVLVGVLAQHELNSASVDEEPTTELFDQDQQHN